jgi:hypothetical protein
MHAATRPRLRYAAPLLRGGGELHVVGSQDVLTIDDPDGAIHRLVELADGSRSTSELYVALAPEYPPRHRRADGAARRATLRRRRQGSLSGSTSVPIDPMRSRLGSSTSR